MKKLSKWQFIIVREIFAVVASALIGFVVAEWIKPGLVSNYYDINLHFMVTIALLVVVLVYPRED